MLLKEIGKMAATATEQFSTVFLCVCVWAGVFIYTILKKVGGKAENSQGSHNSLLIEKMAELTLHAESFQLEVKTLGKQQDNRAQAW